MFGGRLGTRGRREAARAGVGGGPDPADGRAEEPVTPPPTGPFDLADLPADGRERADFGALLVPRVAGTWLRVSAGGPVPVLIATDGVSALELSVLAAPRRQELWATIRADLLAAASDDPDDDADGADANRPGIAGDSTGWTPAGGPLTARPRQDSAERDAAAPEADTDQAVRAGTRGPELHLLLDTDHGSVPTRIVGVDGPRWFLCAIFTGPAASDPAAAPALEELLGATAVVRGTDPMPVREPVPLITPDRHGEQIVDIPAQRSTPGTVTVREPDLLG